ncbi:hypothetical protein PFISCL1PPCAC_11445, partial [Pristionchus fissidentatus]
EGQAARAAVSAQMGGTLSSPLGVARPPHPPHHAPHHGSHHHHHHNAQRVPSVSHSTSVCNHLFSPSDGAQIYLPSRQPHWPAWQQRKNVHPEERRDRVIKLDDPHSRAPFVSPPARRELPPYSSLSLNVVDSNSNYAAFNGNSNGTSAPSNGTTVIPNLYTLSIE